MYLFLFNLSLVEIFFCLFFFWWGQGVGGGGVLHDFVTKENKEG